MSSVHFKINCGYARVAIREYSEVGRGKGNCDTVEQARKFKELFSPSNTYINDVTIFDGYGHRDSKFDRYCKGINGMIGKRSDRESKQHYISCFSSNNWKKLYDKKSDIPYLTARNVQYHIKNKQHFQVLHTILLHL